MSIFLFVMYVIGIILLILMPYRHDKKMRQQQQKIYDNLINLLNEMDGFRERQETLISVATQHTTIRENVFLDIIAKLQTRVDEIEKRIER